MKTFASGGQPFRFFQSARSAHWRSRVGALASLIRLRNWSMLFLFSTEGSFASFAGGCSLVVRGTHTSALPSGGTAMLDGVQGASGVSFVSATVDPLVEDDDPPTCTVSCADEVLGVVDCDSFPWQSLLWLSLFCSFCLTFNGFGFNFVKIYSFNPSSLQVLRTLFEARCARHILLSFSRSFFVFSSCFFSTICLIMSA